MKRLLIVAALPATLLAQTIEGTWQGTLTPNPNTEMRMIFQIVKEGNGYGGNFYNLDTRRQSTLGPIAIQGNTVKIAIPGVGANFEGTIASDNNSLTGSIAQGPGPMPLSLKRATSATAWEIPAPPAPPQPMAADAPLEFEVSTIKLSAPGRTGRSAGFNNGRFTMSNVAFIDMITFAYDIHPRQVANLPSWAEGERFDVVAQPVAEGAPSPAQIKKMLQGLLADRFRLAFHRENRELSVYAITVAPGGPKLAPSSSNELLPTLVFRGRGNLPARNATMAGLANALQNAVLDRPVIDQTGLPGRFDFTLTWTPDEFQFQQAPRAATPADAPTNPGAPPDLFTAMREQLGLKLDGAKAPGEVYVVDRVERPTEN